LAERPASAFLPEHTWIIQRGLRFPEDKAFLEELRISKKFIESHVTRELFQDNFGFEMLATVREPISQIISHYRHIRREPESLWHRAALTLSPEVFFDCFADHFMNFQTRALLYAFSPLKEEIIQKNIIAHFTSVFILR
jgi:hypothetical protein